MAILPTSMPSSIAPIGTRLPSVSPTSSEGGSFSESLQGLLATVDDNASKANTAIVDMVQGKGDVHDAMIALQRAETSLQLTVQIRNKLVQAYQDVMRMPI